MEESAELIDLKSLLPETIGEPNPDDLIDPALIMSGEQPPVIDPVEPISQEVEEELEETTTQTVLTQTEQLNIKETLKKTFGDLVTNFEIVGEDGEPVQVSLDEVELTQELLDQLITSSVQHIKQEESQDKVSIKEISNFTKELIEIDKHGGDIRQLLEYKDAYIDPLDKIDTTTDQGRRDVIRMRLAAAGMNDYIIDATIQKYEADNIIDAKAVEAESEIRQAVNALLEQSKQQAIDAENAKKEWFKTYRKSIKENLSRYELSDGVKAKLADMTTKEIEKGKYEIDSKYNEFRNDPEKAAMLSLFLYSPDEFIEQVSNKKVLEKQKQTAGLLRLSRQGGGGVPAIEKRTQGGDVIKLESLLPPSE